MQPEPAHRVLAPDSFSGRGDQALLALSLLDQALTEFPGVGVIGQIASPVFFAQAQKLFHANGYSTVRIRDTSQAQKLGAVGVVVFKPVRQHEPGQGIRRFVGRQTDQLLVDPVHWQLPKFPDCPPLMAGLVSSLRKPGEGTGKPVWFRPASLNSRVALAAMV